MNSGNFFWKKILLWTGFAFFLGLVLFSFAIVWSVARGVEEDAEAHVRSITAINEEKLKSLLSMSYTTVIDAASSFENLDRLPRARRRAEGDAILARMFNNSHIYNVWAAYLPNSFDGPDAPHGGEYSAAPSGRYVRSYIPGKEGELLSIPNLDENELDDPEISDWYTTPLQTGKIFNNLNAIASYDYKTGEGDVAAIVISSPIFRDGKAIGVVGGDILVRNLVLENELNVLRMATAVFSREERLVFSQDIKQLGMTMRDMRFDHPALIQEAMREGKELFLQDEFSWFLGAEAFTYLKPVALENLEGRVVYLYTALPSSVVGQMVAKALRPMAISLAIMLFAFVILFFFIVYQVGSPLNRLNNFMEMISKTGVAQRLPYLDRQDEIGDLARSVSRLWQYFRMRMNYLALVGLKLKGYLAIRRAIHGSASFAEVSRYLLRLLKASCNADAARFFLCLNDRARLIASAGAASEATELEGHETLTEALEGKHYLIMKSHARHLLGLDFIAPKAWSVCVLPIRVGKHLRAFIILETHDSRRVILHDDEVLNFVSDRLADFFVRHAPLLDEPEEMYPAPGEGEAAVTVAPAEPLRESGAKTGREADETGRFMAAARQLPSLEVDKALVMLGGNAPLYMGMLVIAARELAISMDKMPEYLAANDIHAFTIEAHGVKGALGAIGATSLGEAAYQLEMSGKKNDLESCRLSYPHFEQEIADFVGQLGTILPKREDRPREKRPVEDLAADLTVIQSALKEYNLTLANERLRYSMQFSHAAPDMDETAISEKLEDIARLLDNIEYEAASQAIQELLAGIGKGNEVAGGS